MADTGADSISKKIDFKRELDRYQARRGSFDELEVPDTNYLMVDGFGDPNSTPAFGDAIESLYPVAYAMKFASKRALGRDYVVPPLEGLWWADDMSSFTDARDKSRWYWTLMLMVPEWITDDTRESAVEQVRVKRGEERIKDVRFEMLREGRSIQVLHVGSFDDEAKTLAQLHHEVIPARGLHLAGKHHEIYLSDFRRVPPARQRTILRQPVVVQ